MGIYAYCVVPAGHESPADLRGLSDADVELAAVGEIALWVSRIAKPEVNAEAVQQHNAVVEAAVTQEVTPVPLRFGQWMEDEAAMVMAMQEKAEAYATRLHEFAGCLEFGLRLLDPAEPQGARPVQESTPASGLEYMRSLQESSRLADRKRGEAEQVRARITELLREFIREERQEEARTPHAFLTMSHLVAREHFDAYRERARQIRELYPELRLLLSGPWAPYSFAG